MDITLPLDQIQSSYTFACSLINPTHSQQKIPTFSLTKKRFRAPLPLVRSSLLDQGLRPRPKPKPLTTKEEDDFKNGGDFDFDFKETHSENPNPGLGICGQIEKLVLCRRYTEALELFELLESVAVEIDTYDALVSACISLKSVRGVKRVFNHILSSGAELDLYMKNRVLLMHVKCRMMIDARRLFDDMSERNAVSWNTMIMGLVDSGDYMDAFGLFLLMWEDGGYVGSRTFATMIRASSGLELISPGRQLHSCALKMGLSQDVFVSCNLINMYSNSGSIEDARFVFNTMPEKTTVAWNSIIAGYTFHGYSKEALSMYYKMQDSGAKMDHFTYSIVVRVCTTLASLEHAKQAHAGLVRNGFGSDIVANTALIDFYSKWGRIEDARNIFDKMSQKNVISWNALISGYGNNGRGPEAVELFECMVRERMVPNHVTFLAVLSSCCYSGLSDIGWEIFESMDRDYKVKPRAMHYMCMVELLGREGLLDEAVELIEDAPFKPTLNMWAALLTACRVHKDFDLGKYAAEMLYGIGPEKISNYVVLLNIYNSAGNLEEAAKVLQVLRKKGLRMQRVCTFIEIKKQEYEFVTGDKSHPETEKIYDNLKEVMMRISGGGYVAEEKNMLPDVDEKEQLSVVHHSEKLAISYGLISTPSFSPLQLMQSHRICDDCHSAVKLISLVYGRDIVFRDGSRFHRFKDGNCSCGDYW